MSAVHATITVERGEAEIEVDVQFDHHPACRGQRDSLGGKSGAGPALEPDEPACLEFVEAKAGGVVITLTDEEQEQAEEQDWEDRADALRDYDDPD